MHNLPNTASNSMFQIRILYVHVLVKFVRQQRQYTEKMFSLHPCIYLIKSVLEQRLHQRLQVQLVQLLQPHLLQRLQLQARM